MRKFLKELAPRAGLPGVSSANGLVRQTCVGGALTRKGFLASCQTQRTTSPSSAARTPQAVAAPKAAGEGAEKLEINPMNQRLQVRLAALGSAPRCGARTRTGTPCRCPALRGRRRCRLHGGLSPGAPRGTRNGNYTDGRWAREAIEERKWLRSLVAEFAKKDPAR